MKVLTKRTVVSDAQLLDRFHLHGDSAAFDALFARHAPMVERIALRICGCPSDADDVTQQVFIALAQRAGQLKLRGSIAGWLFRSAWNIATRKLRDDAVRDRKERLAASPDSTSRFNIGVGENWQIACEEILKLDDPYRDVIVLHFIHGMTVTEIAEVLGKPRGTIASQLVRGRNLLQGRLVERNIVLSVGLITLLQATDRPAVGTAAVLGADLAIAGAQGMTGLWKVAAVWAGLTLSAGGTVAGVAAYSMGTPQKTTAAKVESERSFESSASREGRSGGEEAQATSNRDIGNHVPEPAAITFVGLAGAVLMARPGARVRRGGRT
jgi:RNA polymerase sigma factor (sigma-70 family)